MSEWFDNATFWERLEPFLFSHIRTEDDTRTEVSGVESLLRLKPDDRVLDLGCGIGRITLPLARRGYRMTGVDITQAYLKKIGTQAKKENLSIELIKQDMRHFVRPVGFEAVISVFSSFGYFSDPHHDEKTLRNVAGSLAPGGRFLLDLMGREVLKRHVREKSDFHDGATGDYLIEEFSIDRRWEWVEHKWTLVSGQRQKTYTFGIRIFSREELEALLLKCDFAKVDFYGRFSGEPYDENAKRLIAVAHVS